MTGFQIAAYCALKGYPLDDRAGHLNIVYIEGMNPDFSLNNDKLDGWNDLRLVLEYRAGVPEIVFCAVATTEPGRSSTFSAEARRLGGVARIRFGLYKEKWVHGFHQYSKSKTAHPALIQKPGAVIMVHRDLNRDGIRTGDKIGPAWGINQHSTGPGVNPKVVGKYSAGCLVGRDWDEHLAFLELLKTDVRYLENRGFAYSSTIIAGDDLVKNTHGQTA